MRVDGKEAESRSLPDYYETVAQDVIDFCGSSAGRVWVDLGSSGGGRGCPGEAWGEDNS